MQPLGLNQLILQMQHQILRQHGYPVFIAFTLAYHDFTPLKFNILHTQAQLSQQRCHLTRYPIHISILSTNGIVLYTYTFANLIQQF